MVGPLGRGDGGGSWLFEMMMLLDDGRWCQVSLFWFHRMCQLTYANFKFSRYFDIELQEYLNQHFHLLICEKKISNPKSKIL